MEETYLPQIERHAFQLARDTLELRFISFDSRDLHQVERRLASRPLRLGSCRHDQIAIARGVIHSKATECRSKVGKQRVSLRRIAHVLESLVTEPHCVR